MQKLCGARSLLWIQLTHSSTLIGIAWTITNVGSLVFVYLPKIYLQHGGRVSCAAVPALIVFMSIFTLHTKMSAHLAITNSLVCCTVWNVVFRRFAAAHKIVFSRLRAHTENAIGEGNHTHVARYMTRLVHEGVFASAEMTMFRVGPSHNKQDERFKRVTDVLWVQTRLATPEDFRQVVETVKPIRKRTLGCEYIIGCWDVNTYLLNCLL